MTLLASVSCPAPCARPHWMRPGRGVRLLQRAGVELLTRGVLLGVGATLGAEHQHFGRLQPRGCGKLRLLRHAGFRRGGSKWRRRQAKGGSEKTIFDVLHCVLLSRSRSGLCEAVAVHKLSNKQKHGLRWNTFGPSQSCHAGTRTPRNRRRLARATRAPSCAIHAGDAAEEHSDAKDDETRRFRGARHSIRRRAGRGARALAGRSRRPSPGAGAGRDAECGAARGPQRHGGAGEMVRRSSYGRRAEDRGAGRAGRRRAAERGAARAIGRRRRGDGEISPRLSRMRRTTRSRRRTIGMCRHASRRR